LDLPPHLVPDDCELLEIDLADLAVETLPGVPEDPRAFGDEWLVGQQRTTKGSDPFLCCLYPPDPFTSLYPLRDRRVGRVLTVV
jgi:hypothetical protein